MGKATAAWVSKPSLGHIQWHILQPRTESFNKQSKKDYPKCFGLSDTSHLRMCNYFAILLNLSLNYVLGSEY